MEMKIALDQASSRGSGRLEHLGEPLNESNKGYEILQKLGYKPGTALGKQGTGRTEPLPYAIKLNRHGLGLGEEGQRGAVTKTRRTKTRTKRNETDQLLPEVEVTFPQPGNSAVKLTEILRLPPLLIETCTFAEDGVISKDSIKKIRQAVKASEKVDDTIKNMLGKAKLARRKAIVAELERQATARYKAATSKQLPSQVTLSNQSGTHE